MNKILSFLTFTCITLIVLFGADFTLNLSIKNKPNTVLITEILNSQSNIALADTSHTLNQNSAVLGASTDRNIVASNNQKTCSFTPVAGYSIINFLKQNNIDYSFSNRQKLAADFGILNYTGKSEQNLELMKLLITQNQKCLAQK